MESREHIVRVTTTGSAGSAGGVAYSDEIFGFIMGIYTNYQSAPNTTTVVYAEDGGAGRTILSLAASNTDNFKTPVAAIHDSSGSAITDQYTHPFVGGRRVKVTVALSDALTDAVVAHIIVRA